MLYKRSLVKELTSTIAALVVFASLCSVRASAAYVVDGLVNDWGIDLSQAVNRGYLDTHLPTGGLDIDYATEDNADMSAGPYYGAWFVGPEYSLGNMCDAEAIYFDNDSQNAYISIIQGLPIGGSAVPAGWSPSYIYPGDIALRLGLAGNYDYGIEIDPVTGKAHLKSNCVWQSGLYSTMPYNILSGNDLGEVAFAYSASAVNGHYVMEAGIPLSMLGLSANQSSNIGVEWSMSCGNDYLALNADVNPAPVPEPSTLILLFTGLLGPSIVFIRRRYNELRRVFDIAIASVALIVTAPVMFVCAILIKLDSCGPLFYKQVRVGLNRRSRRQSGSVTEDKRATDYLGAPFTIYKLRTMRMDAEKNGPVWAVDGDSRVTKIGKFLRKTRLDEIPQFINVLKGDMSIIGPRPERPVFVKNLNTAIRLYHKRFRMKPGITGLAQTRYQYASSIEDTKKKLKYDLLYVKKACLYMDTKILFDTIGTVVFAKGAR